VIYVSNIEIPKNTLKTDYISDYLWLQHGTIHKIDLVFPAGCAGLAGLRIVQGIHQIFPSNSGQWFIGDDINITFPENYLLYTPPYYLELQAYNLDDLYSHTLIVRIGLLRQYLGKKITTFEELGSY
jgi:hypothetical protein